MIAAPRDVPYAVLRSVGAALRPHPTVLDALEAGARDDLPLLELHGVSRTTHGMRDLRRGALRWSALLRMRGVKRGDRVPILLPTSIAFVDALLGTMLAGAIPVPLASPMTFGAMGRYVRNLAAIVADADARWVIASSRVRDAIVADSELAPRLRGLLGERELAEVSTGAGASIASAGGDDVAFIQYTSGTTGRPKGAVISHRALTANAAAIAAGLDLRPEDVGVSWLPLFHDMGLVGVLLTAVCHPYRIHVMPPELFAMRPLRWLRTIAETRATLSAAPNFAYQLCVDKDDGGSVGDLSSWRLALSGAEPVRSETFARFGAAFGPRGFQSYAPLPVYGMAEATLAVTFARPGSPLALHRQSDGTRVSVGRPVAGASVTIQRDDGSIAREGETGEILVGGPSLMDGYFRNDAVSAEAISGGWLRTGDLGLIAKGMLYVTGRRKEMIIKAGKNLYPHDIERIAEEIAGVRAGGTAAFARPNEDTGTDDLVLVAETTERDDGRRELIAREIRGEVLAALGVKIDAVHFLPIGAVPRTTSGKIQRHACAALAGEAG